MKPKFRGRVRCSAGAPNRIVSLFVGIMLLATLGGSPALAAQGERAWKFSPTESEIEFVGTSLRAEFSGQFQAFDAAINFDPAEPESGSIKVEIDAKSIATGLKEIDTLLLTADWFAVGKFPLVVFEATGFRKGEGGKYMLDGTVTVKGKTAAVALEADFDMAEDPDNPEMMKATAVSEIPLKRLAFKIGTGPWADTKVIADDVTLNVKLAARRAKSDDGKEQGTRERPLGVLEDGFYDGLFAQGEDKGENTASIEPEKPAPAKEKKSTSFFGLIFGSSDEKEEEN